MTDRAVWNGEWPLERVLFALAGTVTLLSVGLALVARAFGRRSSYGEAR